VNLVAVQHCEILVKNRVLGFLVIMQLTLVHSSSTSMRPSSVQLTSNSCLMLFLEVAYLCLPLEYIYS
jgi:hypothetical protein